MIRPHTRPARPQAILTVQHVDEISPNLIRITVGGDGFDAYEDNIFTDRYVKLLLADPEHGLTPPYDLEALRATSPDKVPSRRTYTVRASNVDERWLSIDFVIHGTHGVAGPWARNARPGDTLVLTGAGGKYRPDTTAPWHLLIGDHTALPALSSAIESMPEDVRGHVLISVGDSAGRVLPPAPSGIAITWVLSDEDLLAALEEMRWEDGAPQVFAHGERECIKRVRTILRGHDVPREMLSISAYWARGRAEDQFQAEKRESIGQID
ncbi:siderophore-interacting protein [Microbacterium sp. SY138]|uniref:siderophore-interacting protein n=1 Tax=Microbacterium sp. SY138 TaxID=3149040 RepID=UPI00321B753B